MRPARAAALKHRARAGFARLAEDTNEARQTAHLWISTIPAATRGSRAGKSLAQTGSDKKYAASALDSRLARR